MEEFISRIQQIKKDKLSEREFYEQVLNVLKDMENVSLTQEAATQLKSSLQEIGCIKYDEWKKIKEVNGEKIVEYDVGKGIKQADISTAVFFVTQLLGNYENAGDSLLRMVDGGEEYGWVQQWLKNSKQISQSEQKNSIVQKIRALAERRRSIKNAIFRENDKNSKNK
jgi:hypothetical protein